MALTERRKKILRVVVENYIETAEPIGSKAIAEKAQLTCSSATIRNELAALEREGYLEQPHTSAGRIPSAQGYRLYVNELMEQHKLSLQETERINAAMDGKMRELDRVIDQAGRLVSKMTNYPAFSLAGSGDDITITRFDLLMVDKNSFIAVVMASNNAVKNKLIHLPTDITEPQLQLLNTLLNTTFTGKSLSELNPELMRVAEKAAGSSYGLISLVVSFAMDVLEELGHSTVRTSGVGHLLESPEYQDIDKAHKLMTYLSDEPAFSKLSAPMLQSDADTKILIGPENVAEELKDTSVVLASYDIGEGMKGVIGVVGPTRMDYAKVTAKLSYLADNLSKMFSSSQQSQLPQKREAPALNPPKEPAGEDH
ncbi:MAG: heat-inducible transcriptional repressor HrcA [Clostridiales bacterium]|nr:heat-inducible transcriptional repressor HrcA [Clostridiales bacterium]